MRKTKKPKRLVPKEKNYTNLIIMIVLIIMVPALIAINESKSESRKVDYSDIKQNNSLNISRPNTMLINDTEYQKCITKEYKDDLISEDLANQIDELNKYLKNYNISVKYVDKDTNFNYTYGDKKVYYAASTIKMLMGTYIYDNINNGNIDPNSLMKFTSNYSYTPRKGLEKTKYGTDVSIRDLVSYTIRYSDNAAYEMLLDYIGGKQILKEYGKSLGAKYTLNKDDYGNIDLDDALIYLKKLDDILYKSNEYSEELRLAFVKSDKNYFKTDVTDAAVKYGEVGVAFNELGIVYDNHNYYLIILSNIGSKNAPLVFKEISNRIQKIHNKFYNDRISYCTMLYNK